MVCLRISLVLPIGVRTLDHLELPIVRERISIFNKEPCCVPVTEIREKLQQEKNYSQLVFTVSLYVGDRDDVSLDDSKSFYNQRTSDSSATLFRRINNT